MMSDLILSATRNENLPLRLRKKAGKLFSIESDMEFSTGLFDCVYNGRTGSHIDNKIYLYGKHEAATLWLIRRILEDTRKQGKRPVTFVDVGVNCGVHLIAGAKPSDLVFGFEPWPQMVAVAQRHIDYNKLDHVTLFPFGLSDVAETLPYLVPQGDNKGIGAFVKGSPEEQQFIQEATGVPLADAINLEVRKGDDVMREHDIRPTLIKIDTEGFEQRVLNGLKHTLEQYRPAVIFEYSTVTRRQFPAEMDLKMAFPEGYSFHGILRSRERPALKPFHPDKRYENILAWPEQPNELTRIIK